VPEGFLSALNQFIRDVIGMEGATEMGKERAAEDGGAPRVTATASPTPSNYYNRRDGALWRWNGVDLSQFGDAIDWSGGGTAVLSVHERAGGNNLKIALSAFDGQYYWPVIDATLPPRFVLQYRVRNTDTAGSGPSDQVGGLLLWNGIVPPGTSSMYGVEFGQHGNSEEPNVFVLGVMEGGPATNEAELDAVTADTRDSTGASYSITVNCEPFPISGDCFEFPAHIRREPSLGQGGGVASEDSFASPPTGWAGQRLGHFAFGVNYLNNSTDDIYLTDLAVYPHPMDL